MVACAHLPAVLQCFRRSNGVPQRSHFFRHLPAVLCAVSSVSSQYICRLKPPPARLWLRQPAATTQTAPGAVLRGMEGGRGDFPYPKPENAPEAVSGREGAKGRQGWGNKFPHAPVPTSPMGIPYPIPISSAVQGVVWRGEAPSFAPPPARGQGRCRHRRRAATSTAGRGCGAGPGVSPARWKGVYKCGETAFVYTLPTSCNSESGPSGVGERDCARETVREVPPPTGPSRFGSVTRVGGASGCAS